MKLSVWAKQEGISYRTALRWFHAGTMPIPSVQMPNGTILVQPTTQAAVTTQISHQTSRGRCAVLYARVSSSDQKASLDHQLNRLRDFASNKGWVIVREVREIGSGLRATRPKLLSLLADAEIDLLCVEHRDRLARFGVEMIEAVFKASNRDLVILNESECKDDLVQDFIDLATLMCARLYGRRSAKQRAQRAILAARDAISETQE